MFWKFEPRAGAAAAADEKARPWAPAPARSFNPWKVSTLLLTALLIVLVGGREVSTAEAAGPARLGKALSALRSSKKFLDEAKEPPAPFHAQSLAVVTQAITAVEREIKAYEASVGKSHDKDKDRDKDKTSAKSDGVSKASGKRSDKGDKPAPSKKRHRDDDDDASNE